MYNNYRNSQEMNENLTLWGFSSFDDAVINKQGQLPYTCSTPAGKKKKTP